MIMLLSSVSAATASVTDGMLRGQAIGLDYAK
jgi:hypothetical protein